MQFEIIRNTPTAAALASALHPLDANARIALDAHERVLEVISSISAGRIVDALAELGCEAKPLTTETHVSGGSTCCGGCA